MQKEEEEDPKGPAKSVGKGDRGQGNAAEVRGGKSQKGELPDTACPLPVPQEGFFWLQDGGAPARAHFSGISLGTVMIPF